MSWYEHVVQSDLAQMCRDKDTLIEWQQEEMTAMRVMLDKLVDTPKEKL